MASILVRACANGLYYLSVCFDMFMRLLGPMLILLATSTCSLPLQLVPAPPSDMSPCSVLCALCSVLAPGLIGAIVYDFFRTLMPFLTEPFSLLVRRRPP